jgi:hypothetical protein
MGAPDLLQALQDQGLRLWAEGDRLKVAPKARITDETRRLIREHKAELLAALASDVLPDPQTEARRRRVLSMLDDNPTAKYAAMTDERSRPGCMTLTIALRTPTEIVTTDLLIPIDKWDGVLFIEMLERHLVH